MEKIDFKEGTVNFWIPEGEIDYGDNKYALIFNYENKDGLIKIQKDKDNGLKVYYFYNRHGKCFLDMNVDYLDKRKKHMITVTWNLPERKVQLYINAKLEKECDIDVTPPQFRVPRCAPINEN